MRTFEIVAATCLLFCGAFSDIAGGAQLNLTFNSASGTVLDKDGQGAGFTTRLANTGSALLANDTRLDLNTSAGTLAITTGATTENFHGQADMNVTEAIGVPLSSLGYTGTQDFQVSATFLPLSGFERFDQAGIFIGTNSANMIRAGHITFNVAERFATNTINGEDVNGRFFGFGFNPTDGMDVVIRRTTGIWDVFIDGVRWFPNTDGAGNGQDAPPLFLNSATDLTVGVYALNVANSTPVTYLLDSFRVNVTEFCPFSGGCTPTLQDFQLISDNLFTSVPVGTSGDVTHDGLVDYADFRFWKEQYDDAEVSAISSVPEPDTLVMFSLALLSICSRHLALLSFTGLSQSSRY